MNKKPTVFLAAGLRSPGLRRRNGRIKKMIENEGFEVFFPQERLPVNKNFSDEEIFRGNTKDVKRAKIVVVVFDGAGEGVVFEVGTGHALGKIVVGVLFKKSCFPQDWALKGFWEGLEFRVHSIKELRDIMRLIKKQL